MGVGTVGGTSLARPGVGANSASTAPKATGENPGDSPASETKASGQSFVSPVIKYDTLAKTAVLYFEDPASGEVYQQIPSEKALKEYRARGGRKAAEAATGSGERDPASSARSGAEAGASTTIPGGEVTTTAAPNLTTATRAPTGGDRAGSSDAGAAPIPGISVSV